MSGTSLQEGQNNYKMNRKIEVRPTAKRLQASDITTKVWK